MLQATSGLSVHTFGADGCINSTKTIISNSGLNHGLGLTPDGKTLYVSSATQVWSWSYDAATRAATNQKTVITGISQGVHSTRTIAISPKNPNIILVATGSNANWDYAAGSPATGRACVKSFDMSKAPANGYTYNTQGTMVAYGVRNEVALAFDPNGHAWGAENSGDDFRRTVNGQAVDVHIDNPAEELNYCELLLFFRQPGLLSSKTDMIITSWRPRKPTHTKLVRLPDMLHSLGAVSIQRHNNAQDRIAIRGIA